MSEVNIRELRNHGGEVVDRVQRGERLTVIRSGRPVAELVPIRRTALSAGTILDRWKRLRPVDPRRFRRDVGKAVDSSL